MAFYHAAPGFVNSNWGTEMPWLVRAMVRALQPLGRSADKCGQLLTTPLLQPQASPGFHLLDADGKETPKVTALHGDEARASVWAHTCEVFARNGVH